MKKKSTFISLEQDLSSLKLTLCEEFWRDLQLVMHKEQGEKMIFVEE